MPSKFPTLSLLSFPHAVGGNPVKSMRRRHSLATAMTVFIKQKQSIIRLDARLQHAGMTTWEGVAGFVFLVFVWENSKQQYLFL